MIDIQLIASSRLQELITSKGFYTYILIGSDGTYYTGLTGDIMKRMREHEKGRSKSTRNKLPVKLIYLIVSETRLEARRLEVKIKNRSALRYMYKRMYKSKELGVNEWLDQEGYKKSLVVSY